MRLSALARDNTNRIKSLPKKENHWNWKEKPNTLTLHKRIHRKYGSAKTYICICGKQAMDWAFIGKKEYTDNREDYNPMCRKCHIAMDKPWKKVDRKNHKIIRDKKGKIITTIVKTYGKSHI